MPKKQSLTLFITCALLICVGSVGAQKKGKTVKDNKQIYLSIYLDELPHPIELKGDQIEYSKFSQTLRINAKGKTELNNVNTPFTLHLTLPDFDFNNNAKNNYSNASNYFFDAKKDAALTLQLGEIKFGNLYRSKEKENILSKVATSDYNISCENRELNNNNYIILIRINNKTILRESSESKSRSEVEKLHVSKTQQSLIQIKNPQPFLPKVKSQKFHRSSEVIHKN